MKRFATSDHHFAHANIIKYCSRPFSDVDEMNQTLVKNWNSRVNPGDEVFHLGDLCFHGGTQGGNKTGYHWVSQLNGKIIHVAGNHDNNNRAKSIINSVSLYFGGFNILAKHVPPFSVYDIPDYIDFVICGHVHEKWGIKWLTDGCGRDVLLINVGVDVRKFAPVRMEEVTTIYLRSLDLKKRIGIIAERAMVNSADDTY